MRINTNHVCVSEPCLTSIVHTILVANKLQLKGLIRNFFSFIPLFC